MDETARESGQRSAAGTPEAAEAAPAETGRHTAPRSGAVRVALLAAAVFVVALGIRLAHYSDVRHSVLHEGYLHLYDARYYDLLARRIVAGEGLSDEVYFMAPAYPYFLAGIYRVFGGLSPETAHEDSDYGGEIVAAAYVQCVLGAVICLAIFMLALRAGGTLAGVLAGFGAACYGVFIAQDGLLMATQFITLVNVVALLVFQQAARSRRSAWWILAGVLLGACIWAHGTALLLLPFLAAWIAFAVPSTGWRQRIGRVTAMLVPALLCVAAATIRNYVVGHDLVLLTSNSGMNFFIGNNPDATGSFRPLPADLAALPGAVQAWHLTGQTRKPSDPPPSEVSRRLMQRGLEFVRTQPARWAGLLWLKFRLFWNAVEVGVGDQYYFYRQFSRVLRLPLLSFGTVAPLGLLGVICTARRWRELSLFYIWLGVQAAAYTLFFVTSRYRLVAVACLLVLAGVQVQWWVTSLRARRWGRVAASVALLAGIAVFVHLRLDGFTPQRGWGEQYQSLGMRLAQMGRAAEARQAFEQALTHDFSRWDETESKLLCLEALTHLHLQEGDWGAGEQTASRALKLLAAKPGAENAAARRARLEATLREAQRRQSRN